MPADVVERWFDGQQDAVVNGKTLRPIEHSGLPGTPLSIQRGQAEAYYLAARDSSWWILKKFHNGRNLDTLYLDSIAGLLPAHPGLACGTDREILTTRSLQTGNGHYCALELTQWLEGTILMPVVQGLDWSGLADELRDGQLDLDPAQRLALCRGLPELVLLREQHGVFHRDLSSGNVFICTRSWLVSLIDFDSLYHANLSMPQATTCGTVGYVPPCAWQGGALDAAVSWTAHADRYAMALLNVEFLVLGEGAPLSAEGGIFEQDDLRGRSGRSIDYAKNVLSANRPGAMALFEAALDSTCFDQCPSPRDWLQFVASCPLSAPCLDDLESVEADYFKQVLQRHRSPAPL